MAEEEKSKGSKIWGGTKKTFSLFGRGAKNVGGKATNVVSSVSRGAINVASKSPRSIISTSFVPIRIFLRIVAIIIAILIFIFITSTLYYGFIGKGQIPERILVGLESVNLDKPVLNAVDFLYGIASGSYATQTEVSTIGATKEEQEIIGMKINNFKARKSVVSLKEPITATAQIEVSQASEDKDIVLDFRNACYLEDYTDGEVPKEAIVTPQQMPIYVGQNNFIFSARCDFKDGFDVISSTKITENSELVSTTTDLRILRLMPSFVYEQKIDWQPFTENRYTKNENVPGVINWGLSTGPASFRIGSDESQPFYANTEHMFYAILKYNWPGNLKNINNLEINLPQDIEFMTDDQICDFERYGNSYRLKSSILQDTKIDCSSKEVLKNIVSKIPSRSWMPDFIKNNLKAYAGNPQAITYKNCIDIYKNEFQFSCPFIVIGAESKASQTQITAKVNYIYEMSATSSISLVASGVA
ncbi:MAG: hypothetical protein KJ623_02605 [Nanoarchaeota archaeon]|nr:hypothetical protein [Nanoarchaeota archaeon]